MPGTILTAIVGVRAGKMEKLLYLMIADPTQSLALSFLKQPVRTKAHTSTKLGLCQRVPSVMFRLTQMEVLQELFSTKPHTLDSICPMILIKRSAKLLHSKRAQAPAQLLSTMLLNLVLSLS